MFFRHCQRFICAQASSKGVDGCRLALGMAVATATLEVALDVGDRLAREFRLLARIFSLLPRPIRFL